MINYFGVRIGGGVQVAVTAVKVGLIAFVILAGLFYAHPAAASAHCRRALRSLRGLYGRAGGGSVGLRRMEQRRDGGFRGQKSAAKSAARADCAARSAVIAIYMLANWAYFRVLTPAEVGAHKLVAAEMMQRVQGPAGAAAVSVAAMISIFAALNGSILTGARVPYAAARDGLFFRAAARVHPAFQHSRRFDPDADAAGRRCWCYPGNTKNCSIS